jgi:hypothetical protein
MRSTRYSGQILMKLTLSQQTAEKYSNINYHEISSTESRVVSCRRTERHDEADSRF